MHNRRIALSFLTCWTLMARQQAPPAPASGTPKFTSNTQLVVEVVNVKDKDGKPVEGLTAKDFVITENGVAQTISFCEFQKLDDGAAQALIARDTPANPEPAPAKPAAEDK